MKNLRILIVDDDQTMTRTLADILTFYGYEVTQASSSPQAIEKVKAEIFDLVISDIKMPNMNGIDLHREIIHLQPGLPLVLMTAYAAEELIQEGLDEGVIDALEKPLDLPLLLDFLAWFAESRTITVMDDDPAFCQTLSDVLERHGFRVIIVTDPQCDIEQTINEAQIILLDMKLDRVSGEKILGDIRARCSDLPVLLVTGYRQEMANAIQNALELGAYTCLYKPLDIPELLETLARVRLGVLRGAIKEGRGR